MSSYSLNVSGVAYICSSDDCPGFIGVLITRNKDQLNLLGRLHMCSPELAEDEDHHTCCFDDSCQSLDLEVTRVNDFDSENRIVIPHVMKTGEDNFSLTSKHVQFHTDDLLVGPDAEEVAVRYVSKKLTGMCYSVCIGEMTVNYPLNVD